jgi:hypothetical protein
MSLFGPPSAPDRFATILNGCGKALGKSFHARGLSAPLFWLIWGRLQGMITRFVALACQIREGRWKPPRPRAAASSAERPARVRKPDKLPYGRAGWVVHLGDHHVACCRSQLEWFLAHDAEVGRMMEIDPARMRRILRPLCRMLGAQLPEILRPPPRARAARGEPKARPAPSAKPPKSAKTPPPAPAPASAPFPSGGIRTEVPLVPLGILLMRT